MTVPAQSSGWSPPPKELYLPSDEVHLWLARANQSTTVIESLLSTLSAQERERAERFHFPGGRENYIVGRGVLRQLLGRYLGVEPAQVTLGYSSHGKPSLAEGCDAVPLCFNLAHSGSLILYGFVMNHDIGVDIERHRPDFAGQRIADRFFSPAEAHALRSLPKEHRAEAFLNCWTRKEAYIKARGEGLSFPLDAFDVSVKTDEPVALLHTQGDPEEAARWSLYAPETDPGYVAAVAVEGHDWRIRQWEWEV